MLMELHPHPPTPLRLLSSLVQTQRRCVFVREYVGTSKPSKKTLYERQCVCFRALRQCQMLPLNTLWLRLRVSCVATVAAQVKRKRR